MGKIYLDEVQYHGKIRGSNVSEHLKGFTGEFEFGKTYFLDAPVGEGAWALSWLIGGAIQPDAGEVHLGGSPVEKPRLRQNSWLVRYDEIKRFGIAHQSVKAQVRAGVRKTKDIRSTSEEQILERFFLTPERYKRRLAAQSHEAWRSSCAIGFANGKSVLSFPHMDYLRPGFLSEYRSLWFEEILHFLKSQGILVIFPSQFSESAMGLFNKVISLQ